MNILISPEFEERNLPPLSVGQRLNIATDIAHCLDYLHNERVIPHGNIKSSNVLIQSSTLSALVTDYSLHRLMTPTGMAEQVLNAGALGYSPPEFSSTSKPCPSLKSDVYAIGVILLELLTGKIAGEIICVNDGVVDLTLRKLGAQMAPQRRLMTCCVSRSGVSGLHLRGQRSERCSRTFRPCCRDRNSW
jgi:serine/threonine protein kinase